MLKQILRKTVTQGIIPAIIMASFAQPSFAASANVDKFEDLNLLYRLTQVCYDARKFQKSKYITPAQLKETKASYTRQVANLGLSAAQKSDIQKTVGASDEFTLMSRLIKTGNNSETKATCGRYQLAITLSEYGF